MDKLTQIEAFVDVAEKGSLARAGLGQHITPVMLGRRIDALEKAGRQADAPHHAASDADRARHAISGPMPQDCWAIWDMPTRWYRKAGTARPAT
jgi:hypothetical protein